MSTLELNFRPGFSGNIIITVEPTPCPGERVNYVISVPGPPRINLTSGFNSNNQQLCAGTALNTITYEIEGAANRVRALNLPTGITPFLEITSQLTTITLTTVTQTTIGRTYSISIDNTRFDFRTTIATGTAADHVGNGLANEINARTNNFVATYSGGSLVIEVGPSGQPGNSFTIATTQPVNSAVNFAAPIASPLSKIFSLFGTPTGTATLVNYQIETEAPQPGCETAISSGTIEILEAAKIDVIQGSATASYCSVNNFTNSSTIIMSVEGATGIRLSPSSAFPLPNGLTFAQIADSFDQYEISGSMNQNVIVPTEWAVTFETTGAGCANVSQTITFNLEPEPDVVLVTAGGADRTVCASETILPLRYEIFNPAFAITPSWDVTPTGIIYANYAQNQIIEFNMYSRMGAPTTAAGDFFTFNVNGTPYTAITNGATSTLNITTLVNTLTAWLDASLPNHSVTSNASSITIEADNPGVAFTVTTLSSSTFSQGIV